MSREDWEVFEELRAERKRKRAARRAAFNPGEGWKRCNDSHWQYNLLGDLLNYWPGPMKWQWRGKMMTGEVEKFIQNREKEAKNTFPPNQNQE